MAAATTVARIPGVHLYQVVNMVHTYLSTDALVFQTYPNGGGHVVYAVVGSYSWALSPHVPVLRSQPNMYVFGVEAQPNFFYCVVLPPEVPAEASAVLQGVLKGAADYRDQVAGQPQPPAVQGPAVQPLVVPQAQGPIQAQPSPSRVAQGIMKGGELLAAGMTMAGGLAAQGVVKASAYAISKTTPAPAPVNVTPETQARLDKTRQVTSATASMAKTVSESVISLSSQAAVAMAHTLTGNKGNNPNAPAKPPSALKEVSVASLLAFNTVWEAMWASGKVVMEATKEHGSKVVEHKYGPEAAQASRSSMGVAQDMMKMAHAVTSIRPSVIMKHTATETAKQMVLSSQSSMGSQSSHGGK